MGGGAIRQAVIIIPGMIVDKAVEASGRLVSPSLWTGCYEPGVPLDVAVPDVAFDSTLAGVASTSPSLPALAYHGRNLRYAEIEARVDRAAGALIAAGVRPGDPVVVALPNCPPFAIAALGALRAGGVVIPCRHDEPDSIVARAGGNAARVAFVTADAAPAVAAALGDGATVVGVDPAQGLPMFIRWWLRRGRRAGPRRRSGERWWTWARWIDRAERASERPTFDRGWTALDIRGYRFTHANLLAGAAQLRSWLTDAIPGDETWLLLTGLGTPFGFVAGLGAATALRARLVLLPAWRPDDVFDAIRFMRPSWVASGAPAIRSLVDDPFLARADLRSVRAWLVDEPIEADLAQRFESASGQSLCLGIGAPGVAGLAACNPVNGERRPGTLGTPLPGIGLRVREPGLDVRGPNVAGAGEWLPLLPDGRIGSDGHVRSGGPSDFGT